MRFTNYALDGFLLKARQDQLEADPDNQEFLATLYLVATPACLGLKLKCAAFAGVDFASLAEFQENVKRQQSGFTEVFDKAIDEKANANDRMALVKHSMCFRS